jgi:hypothetical protein
MGPKPKASGGIRASALRRIFLLVNMAEPISGNGCPHHYGCVKYAYPHGHDELLMIGLDNMTKKQTLLRTVPDVTQDRTFLEFRTHQVHTDSQGFPVTKADDYEMVMVHHHPLQKKDVQHGMGNYLLYMTPAPAQRHPLPLLHSPSSRSHTYHGIRPARRPRRRVVIIRG